MIQILLNKLNAKNILKQSTTADIWQVFYSFKK